MSLHVLKHSYIYCQHKKLRFLGLSWFPTAIEELLAVKEEALPTSTKKIFKTCLTMFKNTVIFIIFERENRQKISLIWNLQQLRQNDSRLN